jgi:hypothetical protein
LQAKNSIALRRFARLGAFGLAYLVGGDAPFLTLRPKADDNRAGHRPKTPLPQKPRDTNQ